MKLHFLWVYLSYFFKYESNICSSPGFRHISYYPKFLNKQTKNKNLKIVSPLRFMGHFCKFFHYWNLILLDMKTWNHLNQSGVPSLTLFSIDLCFNFPSLMFILCYLVWRALLENVRKKKKRQELRSSAFCLSSTNIAPSAPGNWPSPSLFSSG